MATLPSYVIPIAEGYGEENMPAVLRTEMESGPPKQAMVGGISMWQMTPTFYITTSANLAAFKTWVRVTLRNGADWFDYADPVAGATVLARIVGGKIRIAPVGAGVAWKVYCQLEKADG